MHRTLSIRRGAAKFMKAYQPLGKLACDLYEVADPLKESTNTQMHLETWG
jgi:hypothetical protein